MRMLVRRGLVGMSSLLLVVCATPAYADAGEGLAGVQVGRLQQAVEENPADFGGLFLRRDTGHVVVRVKSGHGGSAAVVDALTRVQGGDGAVDETVVTVDVLSGADRSLDDLRQLRDRVMTQGPLSEDAGVASSWGINEEDNTVVVGVQTASDPALQALAASYGGGVVLSTERNPSFADDEMPFSGEIVEESPSTGGGTTSGDEPEGGGGGDQPSGGGTGTLGPHYPSRLVDSATGYHAGARTLTISGGIVSTCTAGWMLPVSNQMFSAGHCQSTGSTVYQGYCENTSRGCVIHKTGTMGKVIETQWGENRIDWGSTSGGKYSGRVFVGAPATTRLVNQRDILRGSGPLLNSIVCPNGSVTGYHCGKVTATEGCKSIGDFDSVCGQVTVVGTTVLVQHGDSGGPVIDGVNAQSTAASFWGVISSLSNGGKTMSFTTARSICAASSAC